MNLEGSEASVRRETMAILARRLTILLCRVVIAVRSLNGSPLSGANREQQVIQDF
jgi:hypothetical protein